MSKKKVVTNLRQEDLDIFTSLCKGSDYSMSEVIRRFVSELIDSFIEGSKDGEPTNSVKKFMRGEQWQKTRHLL